MSYYFLDCFLYGISCNFLIMKFDLYQTKIEPNLSSTSTSQSAVALTSSTSVVKSSSPLTTVPDLPGSAASTSPTASIIQNTSSHQLNSLVVSVPLLNTNLSPHTHIVNSQSSGTSTPHPFAHLSQERSYSGGNADRDTPNSSGTWLLMIL